MSLSWRGIRDIIRSTYQGVCYGNRNGYRTMQCFCNICLTLLWYFNQISILAINSDHYLAMTPVTWGVAIEVPEKETASSVVLKSADSMSEPGARMSTQGPKLEK